MSPPSIELVERWWSAVFTVDRAQLWRHVTVCPHTVLDGYDGWYVAWRGDGVHVSAPASAAAAEVASLHEVPAAELQQPVFWDAFAQQRHLHVMGPEQEWDEAGMTQDPAGGLAFGVLDDGHPVAAAVLEEWGGSPRDVNVLVAPSARGRGLGETVGAHDASYAVRETGLARWRAPNINVGLGPHRPAARLRAVGDSAGGQAVTGLKEGRVFSKAAIRSS